MKTTTENDFETGAGGETHATELWKTAFSKAESEAVSKTQKERWIKEAAYFDREAERTEAKLKLDPLVVRRYTAPRLRRRFNLEYRFGVMGSLEGKRVLDVGCGDGSNAVLLALRGARVTGIDLSPKTVELARRRAEANGVGDMVEFICSPIETAPLPEQYFDIVWGDSILHHVLEDLDPVLSSLMRSLKPDGLFVFAEPVNLCASLRRLRMMVPVPIDGTPDERPLVAEEVERVVRCARRCTIRRFRLLTRLDRFILKGYSYEHSSAPRRLLYECLSFLDCSLLSLPGLKRLTGVCVLHGQPAT
jgi:2-polyprenyl-3-methyl-5-hydroxy-6-metoxy-1,4-benzoquinol methylase